MTMTEASWSLLRNGPQAGPGQELRQEENWCYSKCCVLLRGSSWTLFRKPVYIHIGNQSMLGLRSELKKERW
jgi:hypothetical protein